MAFFKGSDWNTFSKFNPEPNIKGHTVPTTIWKWFHPQLGGSSTKYIPRVSLRTHPGCSTSTPPWLSFSSYPECSTKNHFIIPMVSSQTHPGCSTRNPFIFQGVSSRPNPKSSTRNPLILQSFFSSKIHFRFQRFHFQGSKSTFLGVKFHL